MPIYEYSCNSCRRGFEVEQGFNDDRLTTCEACGGILKRVFHPVGIVLKGSGFYATDNRGRSKGASKEPAKTGDTSPSSSTTQPESKPASKKSGGKDAAAS